MTSAIPLWDRPTAVYRAYAVGGELLYVGISQLWNARLLMHRKGSPWWRYVWHIEIEVHPHRHAAIAVESWAIRYEAPIHNEAEQWRLIPFILPRPIDAYGYRVRHWDYHGDYELPILKVA